MSGKWKTIAVLVMAALILPISAYGFGSKLYEFFVTAKKFEGGVFAVTPIVNYVLVGIGFLFLLGWAIFTGMFHDIEAPKYTMLERERELDQAARHAHHPPP